MRQLLLSVLLLITAQVAAEPLYWQVEKGKLKYIIVGSVHVGDESMYPLPKRLFDELESSQGLIVETDTRNKGDLVYPTTRLSSRDVLTTQQQKELLGLANLLEINGSDLLNTPPWAAALAIQMKQIEYLGYSTANGVDVRLMVKADLLQVPTLSLESMQFQIDLLTGQPMGGQEMLVSVLEEFDHSENALRCLITSWKNGDIDKLNEFAQLTSMSEEFEYAFLTERNLDWAKKLASPEWLPKRKGQYLIVVGTLHLIGEQSLLKMLEREGFTIKQLSQSQPTRCEFKY
ncbi:TraB/GumN family protein [Vibrio sinaloensis]|uniref:TraB/GumN family protein n=1 Tax=Photobacterium sp. (strain ATCC 43367) TaxID=379097 RepID=UPI00204CC81B|nr:TraB/GumN family protein [Vibrio sinaloensis]UPQ87324.1 TraB/GumN family protein [Vibrio sinaloensis]